MPHQITFLLALLMASLAWAGPTVFSAPPTFSTGACEPPASFLWRLLTSPLCLLTIGGYTMLLISPYTRHIALSPLPLPRILCGRLELAIEKAAREKSDGQVTALSQSLTIADAKVEKILASDAQRQIATLTARIDIKDVELRHLNTTVSGLQADLSGVRAAANYQEGKATKLCSIYQDLRSARSEEVAALKDSAKAQEKAQGELFQRATAQLDNFRRVMDVLFRLGEAEGDALVVGVAFARAMGAAGLDIGALGIDRLRLALLCEFVLAGQGQHLAVQPQTAMRGFRLVQKS
ncbi:hypothetical protein BDW02DRAFT_625067 [Decorospora gaudefroyi]|uniref:Uncharacterized protein n=1 Tax=Decorospora gaudefroyi TaxID=184978 RepID=A0A6A5KJ27_9PLEO|nr:hypothetical protein BDW02DRAFT_625067 [Decorospora gaudefroyi]